MIEAGEFNALVAREADRDPETLHLNHGWFGAVPKSLREEQRRSLAVTDRGPSAFFRRSSDQEVDRARLVAAEFLVDQTRSCNRSLPASLGTGTTWGYRITCWD